MVFLAAAGLELGGPASLLRACNSAPLASCRASCQASSWCKNTSRRDQLAKAIEVAAFVVLLDVLVGVENETHARKPPEWIPELLQDVSEIRLDFSGSASLVVLVEVGVGGKEDPDSDPIIPLFEGCRELNLVHHGSFACFQLEQHLSGPRDDVPRCCSGSPQPDRE